MEKLSVSGIASCDANFSRIFSRTCASVIVYDARRSTIESSRTALIVNVSGPALLVGLSDTTEARGDLTGVQGRWNCPGGRFWKGFGKRSGVEIWCVDVRSRPGVD